MAERIVSPGVFTREQDLSFLPQGIAEIGAAIIGPFEKGPALIPTIVESQNKATLLFGDGTFFTPFTVQNYLKSSGRITIVRVLGEEGYTSKFYPITGSSGELLVVLNATKENPDTDFTLTISGSSGDAANFVLTGSDNFGSFNVSFQESNVNYVTKVFGTNPLGSKPVFVYANFPFAQSQSVESGMVDDIVVGGTETLTFGAFQSGSTPQITSQEVGGTLYDMFKIATISDGTSANQEIKVGIIDVRFANEVPGSDFGTFGIVVRRFDDTDKRSEVLETYSGLTLDPTSPRYLPRVIGDQYRKLVEDSEGNQKIQVKGDWPNRSDFIRIDPAKDFTALPTEVVPFGFKEYVNPVDAVGATGSFTTTDGSGFKTVQLIGNETNSRAFFGVAFDDSEDVDSYMFPLPSGADTGSNVPFQLANFLGIVSASALSSRKFIMGFQGAFNGQDPRSASSQAGDISAGNSQGFDLSTPTADGTSVYRKAIGAVANPDEFDINLLALPGVIHSLHSAVTNFAISSVEDRGDTFFIMDGTPLEATIDEAVDAIADLDTNYAGVYFPWVRILNPNTQLPIWVPPSVLLPGVYAFSDQVSQEWFAPAGLNRGGLTEAVAAFSRLTFSERDTLYEGRVNPIATFPGQGIVAWGQKTLQAKASALDRINVRRLLIALKKFIASTSNFLVFEQNVASTRNRFLNVVNPFLESVQQRAGLFAFKVVMDETLNTPDVIDRNQLVGQIFLQPARTAEFIILDFNILPTGATFG